MVDRRYLVGVLCVSLVVMSVGGVAFNSLEGVHQVGSEGVESSSKCTRGSATDTITSERPSVHIRTLSGMPEKPFNPFFDDVNFTIAYRVTVQLPRGVENATIRLPENTTVVGSGGSVVVESNESVVVTDSSGAFTIHSDKRGEVSGTHYTTYTPSFVYSNIPDLLVSYKGVCVNVGTREANVSMSASNGTIRHTEVAYYKIPPGSEFSEVVVRSENTTVTIVKPEGLNLSKSNMSRVTQVTRAAIESYSGYPSEVVLFIVPSTVRAASGLHIPQGEESSFVWVTSEVNPDGDLHVVTHELMHTRQQYSAGRGMRWFTEASAEYFAVNGVGAATEGSVVPPYYDNDYADYEDKPVLTDPSSWEDATPYLKGAVVLYHLDMKLERHGYSVNELLLWMNRQSGVVTYEEFVGKVRYESNKSVAQWSERHINGTALPATESGSDQS